MDDLINDPSPSPQEIEMTRTPPWGTVTVLEEGLRYRINRIVIKPGHHMSTQMHYHRSEHWIVVSGTARVICDEKETLLKQKESTYVPMNTRHRVENPGSIPLVMIEVQNGEYLGDDDIHRFDDREQDSFLPYVLQLFAKISIVDEKIILVTGAARSGKSEWAEYLAKISQKPVIYIATSAVDEKDQEWCDRIEKHRQRRLPQWQTQEIPRQLSETIDNSPFTHCLLIDSLGTWVANCLEMSAAEWLEISDRFLYSLKNAAVDVILVAEETGWGVVPAYPLGRLFRDRLGDLCRRIGTIADAVYLVTGGHALNLSQLGQSLSIIGQQRR